MTLLAGNAIQNLFGSVLGSVLYETAVLQIRVKSTVRDPGTGTFPYTVQSAHDVKVQRDACTEAQRAAVGYSAEDVRLMVLQSGLAVQPNTDNLILYRGSSYRVMGVDADPARVYWDCRARLIP